MTELSSHALCERVKETDEERKREKGKRGREIRGREGGREGEKYSELI